MEIDRKGLTRPVALLSIIARVADYYGLPTDEIRRAARGPGADNRARWVAMKLCQDVGGAKLQTIATLFNVGHYSTVSQTIGRLKRALAEDKDLLEAINMLSQNLTP